jgi:uncharacterized protein involved in outer membrane biogenesis
MALGRKLRIVLVVAVVLLVAIPIAVRLLVPKEKIIRLLSERVAAGAGWRLAARDASIGLVPPSLRVTDLVLSGNAAYDDSSEIRIPMIRIQPRLGSILRRRLQFAQTVIERPTIRLAVAAAPPGGAGAAARGGPGGGAQPAGALPFALSLDRLEVRDGRLAYRDTTGFEMTLAGLSLTLSLEADAGFETIAIPGEFAAESVSVAMPLLPPPGAPPPAGGLQMFRVGGFRAAGAYRCALHPRAGTLDIERGDVRVNDLAGTVTGRVTDLATVPNVDLAISATDASVADVLSLLPDDILAQKQDLEAAGRATVAARVTGPTWPPGSMRYEGAIDLAESRVAYKGIPGAVESLAGHVRFTHERLDIDSLAARFEGEPFRLGGSVLLTTPPTVDLDVAGVIPLDLFARWPAFQSAGNLAGTVRIRLRAAGPVGAPQAMRLDGTVDLEGVSARPRGWTTPVEGVAGRVTLAGTEARIEGIRGRMGASDFRVDGTVTGLLGKAPAARVEIASRFLDLDALAKNAGAVPAAAPPAGAAVVAAPLLLPELPDLKAAARIRVDSLVAQQIPMRDARGEITLANRVLHAVLTAGDVRVPQTPLSGARLDVTIKDRRLDGTVAASKVQVGRVPLTDLSAKVAVLPDGVIDITDGRAKAFTGTLGGDVKVTLAGAEPRYTFRVAATDIEMNDFLSHLTPLKNALYGKMKLDGNFSGAGLTAQEAIAKLTADGSLNAKEGRIAANPLLGGIAGLLGLPELNEVKFRAMQSGFRVAGGRVMVDDLTLDAPDAKWRASGSIGFDGTLDYRLGILLSKPLADRAIQKVGDAARYIVTDKGELPVDLIVSGNARKPAVSVDLSKAMSRVKGGALQDAARSLGLDEKALADPKGAAVKGLLDKIGVGKGAGTPPPPPPPAAPAKPESAAAESAGAG